MLPNDFYNMKRERAGEYKILLAFMQKEDELDEELEEQMKSGR